MQRPDDGLTHAPCEKLAVVHKARDPVQIQDIGARHLDEKIFVAIDLVLTKQFDVRAAGHGVGIVGRLASRLAGRAMWRGIGNKAADGWI